MNSTEFIQELVVLEEASSLALLRCYRRFEGCADEERRALAHEWLKLAGQARERAQLLQWLAQEFPFASIPFSRESLAALRDRVKDALARALQRDLDLASALYLTSVLVETEIDRLSATLLDEARSPRIGRRVRRLVPARWPFSGRSTPRPTASRNRGEWTFARAGSYQ